MKSRDSKAAGNNTSSQGNILASLENGSLSIDDFYLDQMVYMQEISKSKEEFKLFEKQFSPFCKKILSQKSDDKLLAYMGLSGVIQDQADRAIAAIRIRKFYKQKFDEIQKVSKLIASNKSAASGKDIISMVSSIINDNDLLHMFTNEKKELNLSNPLNNKAAINAYAKYISAITKEDVDLIIPDFGKPQTTIIDAPALKDLTAKVESVYVKGKAELDQKYKAILENNLPPQPELLERFESTKKDRLARIEQYHKAEASLKAEASKKPYTHAQFISAVRDDKTCEIATNQAINDDGTLNKEKFIENYKKLSFGYSLLGIDHDNKAFYQKNKKLVKKVAVFDKALDELASMQSYSLSSSSSPSRDIRDNYYVVLNEATTKYSQIEKQLSDSLSEQHEEKEHDEILIYNSNALRAIKAYASSKIAESNSIGTNEYKQNKENSKKCLDKLFNHFKQEKKFSHDENQFTRDIFILKEKVLSITHYKPETIDFNFSKKEQTQNDNRTDLIQNLIFINAVIIDFALAAGISTNPIFIIGAATAVTSVALYHIFKGEDVKTTRDQVKHDTQDLLQQLKINDMDGTKHVDSKRADTTPRGKAETTLEKGDVNSQTHASRATAATREPGNRNTR